MLAALQYKKASSHSILVFLISFFGCPDHHLVRPRLQAPASNESDEQVEGFIASFKRLGSILNIVADTAVHYIELL